MAVVGSIPAETLTVTVENGLASLPSVTGIGGGWAGPRIRPIPALGV
jgi:hypothetical protein